MKYLLVIFVLTSSIAFSADIQSWDGVMDNHTEEVLSAMNEQQTLNNIAEELRDIKSELSGLDDD